MKVNFGLSSNKVERVLEGLSQALADTYALYFMTLSGHWNYEGKEFISIHEMLEKQVETHSETGDALAERIRLMGHKVPTSLKIFSDKATLRPFSEEAGREEILQKLAEANEACFISFRKLSKEAEAAGDDGLVDLLGGIIRQLEVYAWKLRSEL